MQWGECGGRKEGEVIGDWRKSGTKCAANVASVGDVYKINTFFFNI